MADGRLCLVQLLGRAAETAAVHDGHEGLEAANATLMGQVTVLYDDELTSREALLKEMARGGFRELQLG